MVVFFYPRNILKSLLILEVLWYNIDINTNEQMYLDFNRDGV